MHKYWFKMLDTIKVNKTNQLFGPHVTQNSFSIFAVMTTFHDG